MRRPDPLIIGAGPAGLSAAITLARAGARPLLLEKQRDLGDALCGGFVSWRTMATLNRLGVDVTGHPITAVRIIAGLHMAEAALPKTAFGVSRYVMDGALLKAAIQEGAGIERGVTVRHIDMARERAAGCAIFLATGKQDLRGAERPRVSADPAVGLRVRLAERPSLRQQIGNAIELHLFDRGYAGVELQEDGSANICLAVRKSLLADAGRDPAQLLDQLAARYPHFGARMAGFSAQCTIDAVAAIPYGWRQISDPLGVYRLGDQAAVIPSLAGEGNGIALASGESAALAWQTGLLPAAWQHNFAQRTAGPVGRATQLWHWGERPRIASLATRLFRLAPPIATQIAALLRLA